MANIIISPYLFLHSQLLIVLFMGRNLLYAREYAEPVHLVLFMGFAPPDETVAKLTRPAGLAGAVFSLPEER